MPNKIPHNEERAVRAVVEGRVQGVGFRCWTVQAAKRFGITGWVQNCPDYSVEIFAEGEPDALHNFFNAVQHGHPLAYVARCNISTASYKGFDSFKIRY